MFWIVRLASIGAAIAGCFLLDMFVSAQFNDAQQRLVILAGLYVTLAVSLNLINGITGQFSIGHAAFYQVGAYSAGYLTLKTYGLLGLTGIPWLMVMMVFGALAAALAGFTVGLPSLRLRGDYLAIVTLGFGEIIRIIVQNIEALGGSYGLNVEPRLSYLWLVWLLAVVCISVCRNLLKSAHGLPFLSVREDEVASSAMGVDVARTKVTAFVIGSAFAGAAGALLTHSEGFVSPKTFPMDMSFIILTMVVLGGTGSITGSVIAALLLFYVPEYLRGLQNPDGTALVLPGAVFLAAIVAVVAWVVAQRKLNARPLASGWHRFIAFLANSMAAIVLYHLLSWALSFIPLLAEPRYEAQMLRMVIFAGTLIILMLVRPQGLLGHHEFSVDALKRLFWRKAAQGGT